MFKRLLNKKTLVLIITLFFCTSSETSEIIKLRFNEINIKFEPENKSHYQNSKRLIKSLNNYFLKIGQSESHHMNIILKRYNVKVFKPKKEDILSFFKDKDYKIFVHEVDLVLEVKNTSKLVGSMDINVKDSKEFQDTLSLSGRRLINSKVYKGLEEKLKKEIKKILLLKFGDFIAPN